MILNSGYKMAKGKNKGMRKEVKNVAFNVVFAVMTLGLPVLFYQNIILTTVLCGIVALAGLIKWRSEITVAIFVFGLFFGTLCEITAVSYGVWEYAYTNFFNIPLWLFVVWGNASAFIYQIAIEFERLGLHD